MEGDRDMYRQFQDWCLRTYGDSGKTKTVTRRKYDRIVQLLNGSESSSTDNAKFKFWVKSKGFQLGAPDEISGEKQVLYVPVKTTTNTHCPLKRVPSADCFFSHCGLTMQPPKSNSVGGQHSSREAYKNGKPPTLVTSMIDYNMPITMAYMKHMKLQLLNSQNNEEDSSLDSDEFDMSDSTRMSAVNSDLSSNLEERMSSPQNLHNQQDEPQAPYRPTWVADARGAVDSPADLSPPDPGSAQPIVRRPLGTPGHSPAHSFSSYDSGKNESVGGGVEDLSLSRGDEDEDEHDDQEDSEKAMETEGVETERLKAFNMFVRLFVDENLDRMVPISKQPKEKIQAIIESCRRQFPEYQERARKRIRTYLKSCRRMKRNDFDASRPIPSHLTSAAAENILASACESESRNAAKRMRLDRPQIFSSYFSDDQKIFYNRMQENGRQRLSSTAWKRRPWSQFSSSYMAQSTPSLIEEAGSQQGAKTGGEDEVHKGSFPGQAGRMDERGERGTTEDRLARSMDNGTEQDQFPHQVNI
ncbi:UNVERIFIED_CONTAM: hypothetical protein FKN15_047816 [Acipenser sinensis]